MVREAPVLAAGQLPESVIMTRCVALFLLLLCPVCAAAAENMAITPFAIFNQSPLVQIYGLPHDSGADIVPSGALHLRLNQDLSSNYTVNINSREQIILDGESYRTAVTARYGIAPHWEVGVEIPYIVQGGGFIDSFVIEWHNNFGLPQGGRNSAPKGRLLYSYRKDGVRKLLMDRAGSGIGDVSLTGGVGLYEFSTAEQKDALALKGAIKLPTGDSSYLRGSGGTDFSLQLCGSRIHYGESGSLGLYGSAGGVVMSGSDVLSDQHNLLAGVGTLGLGWGPASWISFKVQLNAATPLYHDSSLAELSSSSMLLVVGGALKLPGEYLLDIGVTEDVAVATAPDVSFHLGLSKRF